MMQLASKWRANENLGDAGSDDGVGDLLGDLLVAVDDGLGALLARLWIDDRSGGVATDDTTLERVSLGGVLLGLAPRDPRAFLGPAVISASDHVLRDVDETARQVARVGGAQRRVGETLARTVGGDEVFENGHPFAEVAPHRDVDDPTGGVGHQAAHAAQLADVALVTAGTRG